VNTLRRLRAGLLVLAIAAGICGNVSATALADKVRSGQWHLTALKISEAHQLSPGLGAGIKIGIMDTGVDGNHPDLTGNVLPGLDLYGQDPKGWTDAVGHGSGMAGLAVAHGHGAGNGDGALGIAPRAQVIPVRIGTEGDPTAQILGKEKAASPADFARGVSWLIDQGARIISIAYTVSAADAAQNAIKAARSKGVIVIISAGNKSDGNWVDGGTINASITVGASDQAGQLDPSTAEPGPFSPINLLAPGREVVSTSFQDKYRIGTGTSPSSAILAGTAALIWSKYPTISADEVVWRMEGTAHDVGAAGNDKQTGWGVVDPVAALAPNVPPSPGAVTPPSTTGCPVAGEEPPACLPPRPTEQQPAAQGSDSSGLGTPAIVAGGVALVIIVGLAVTLFVRRRRHRATDHPPA